MERKVTDFPLQLIGMPQGPLWSSRRCPALLASSLALCPSPTSPPSRGSTAPSLPGLCSSSLVSLSATLNWNTGSCSTLNRLYHLSLAAFFVLLGMAIYTGVTVNFLGKRFGDWRFSWSYILGWVAMLMTFFAGVNVFIATFWAQNWRRSRKHSKETKHDCWCLLQVFCTYAPTECVNAEEATAPARGRWRAGIPKCLCRGMRGESGQHWLICKRDDVGKPQWEHRGATN